MVKSVCVYCASSSKADTVYLNAASELGKLLALNDVRCIYGAGETGLMGALADAVLANNGYITGVIPQFMCDEDWHHKAISECIVTQTMHERKEKMAFMADAVVALPGGCGTLEELLEAITWKQLGLFVHPIIIVNVNGYFDPLLSMLDKAIDENFMRQEHSNMWQVVNSASEVLEAIAVAPQWHTNARKIAAI